MQIRFLDLQSINMRYASRFQDAFERFVGSGRYLLGPELLAFEREFAEYCGTAHAVGVANGLDALRLALHVLDMQPGDEVIVPAHTFIATWLAVTAVGAKPIAVDVDPMTGNMDPQLIEDAISNQTKAIVPVHLYGLPADMERIKSIAKSHRLALIEDAAQAHGATLEGKHAGQWGDSACFSFYPGKNLGALGDGGAIVCNDADVAERLRKLRNYGSTAKYLHDEPGFNSRLDEIQASLLRLKLGDLDTQNTLRRDQAAFYHTAFSGIGDLRLLHPPAGSLPAWHLYVIRTARRDELRTWLAQEGIETLIHYPVPPHRQPAYAARTTQFFPEAEKFAETCLSLPIGPHLGNAQIEYVCERVSHFFQRKQAPS